MDDSIPQSMSPADETLVSRHRDIISNPTRILLSYTEDAIGDQMAVFCDQLQTLLPAVTVKKVPADGEAAAIHVWNNIHFRIIPTGKLLETFLFSLLGHETLAGQDMGVDPEQLEKRVGLPAALKMYVALSCPYCPQVLPRGLFLAGALPAKIDITIVDAQLYEEEAKAEGIRSVPVTILDDRFRWNGVFQVPEVVDMMADRDPAQLSADTLKKMISDGDAEGVAILMDEFNTVIPSFLDLVAHERWSLRLGAMVAFEYLAESNGVLSRMILEQLWDRFDEFDDAVKGDIIHLFGVLSDPELVSRLSAINESAYSDSVKRVAREVMESEGK